MISSVICFVTVSLLALVHLSFNRISLLGRYPEIWVSIAGGVGISYAFLSVLPKLAKAQPLLQAARDSGLYGYLEHHSYLLALTGLVFFYVSDGIVNSLLVSVERSQLRSYVHGVITLHMGLVSGYYLLVGYLVGHGFESLQSLILFGIAMALHFLAMDYSLYKKLPQLYCRVLGKLFAAATLLGTAIAVLLPPISVTTLALWNSLFAGILIINTIRDKLPGKGQGDVRMFLLGTVGYALILLAIEY